MSRNIHDTSRRQFLHLTGKCALLGAFAGPIFMSGCKTMGTLADIGADTGVITKHEADALIRSSTAIAKTFEDITPEQEYYIGRTVGAVLIDKFPPEPDRSANTYLNVLGQTLAQASNRPETFGGYHFLLLDSDKINAFAAPGGHIFVTKGMLRCCEHETAVAAVLAHEISHVEHKHGLQAIKKSRLTSALTILAAEGAKKLGGEDLTRVTEAFEESVSDVTKTLVNSGYSRSFEREADKSAITILKRVGYNPQGLIDMLKIMDKRLKPGGPDFAKTHPEPWDRIRDIKEMMGSSRPVTPLRERQARFQNALGSMLRT